MTDCPDTSPSPPRAFDCIAGRSASIRHAVELATLVAATPRTTVLLIGETGTGKELFARGIHYGSPAADAPFVAVNCAAIPESLLEGELFGHEKGAFTGATARKTGLFELAGDGTLFLDEIHQLPLNLQPKLLRALEARSVRPLGSTREIPVRCRIIAATNVALEPAVARAEFRPDLYYRLSVFHVDIPPLREREDDVALLAMRFLGDVADERGGGPRLLAPDAADALRAHSWPGNVRELRNVIERAAILAGGDGAVRARHLMLQQRSLRSPGPAGDAIGSIMLSRHGTTLDAIALEAVRITLEHTRGNRSAAARLLGVSRPTLARMIRALAGVPATPRIEAAAPVLAADAAYPPALERRGDEAIA